MLDRLVSAVVALSLAFLVWLYVRSRDQETLDNVLVPVQITLSAGQSNNYELEINGASQVPVSFTGSPSRTNISLTLPETLGRKDTLRPGSRTKSVATLDGTGSTKSKNVKLNRLAFWTREKFQAMVCSFLRASQCRAACQEAGRPLRARKYAIPAKKR